MASLNKVTLIGHLGRDPEMRTFPSGDRAANVSIATTEKWKDKQSGEMKEATEWHNLVFTGRMAEIVGEYLEKGSQIYVEGSLRTRKWEKDGVTRYSTEIRVNELKMLGGREGGERPAPAPRPAAAPRAAAPASSGFADMDDDIPW